MTRAVDDVIFLLGAGASKDAGMPLVAELTHALRKQLSSLCDINGSPCPEFGRIFDFVQQYDQSVASNYERLFEWIKIILDVEREPFRKLIKIDIDPKLIEAMAHFMMVVGTEIARLFNSYQTSPSYLAMLGDFISSNERLKVFTLNYDCCLEDACRDAGIDVTTGFDPVNHHWNSALFEQQSKGINLYKLHGSLRWFGARDRNLPDDDFRRHLVPLELRPEATLPSGWEPSPSPTLVLGPEKIHPFDPFVTLLSEFQKAMYSANTLVIIGYGFGDSHINELIDRSLDAGTRIIDVAPDTFHGGYISERHYSHLQSSAKNALTNGAIKSALESFKT